MDFHTFANSFCDRLPITIVRPSATGMVTRETTARIGESTNIITSTPSSMKMLVSTCDSVCCSDWATLSTSLVTRLSSSPRGWLSKYFSGIRLIFDDTCSRIRYTERCTTPLIRMPELQVNRPATR